MTPRPDSALRSPGRPDHDARCWRALGTSLPDYRDVGGSARRRARVAIHGRLYAGHGCHAGDDGPRARRLPRHVVADDGGNDAAVDRARGDLICTDAKGPSGPARRFTLDRLLERVGLHGTGRVRPRRWRRSPRPRRAGLGPRGGSRIMPGVRGLPDDCAQGSLSAALPIAPRTPDPIRVVPRP